MSHTTTAPATAPEAVRRHRLLIDGRWVDPSKAAPSSTVDPSTGTKLAELAAGGPRDVDLAVQAARRAFDEARGGACRPRPAPGSCTASPT